MPLRREEANSRTVARQSSDTRVPGSVAGSPGSDALPHVSYGFPTADTSGIDTTNTDSSGTTGT